MRRDYERMAYQLHRLLSEKGYSISLRTILWCRTMLGWTFRGSAYCQIIRDANKAKQLQWAREHKDDSFDDVIWSDECTVQMESHRRFVCRKHGETPRPKPRWDYLIHLVIIKHWDGQSPSCFCNILCVDLNTQPRYTCGQGSASEDVQGYVFLKGSWRKSCLWTFSVEPCYLSFKICVQMNTSLCRIMILNIHQVMPNSGLKTTGWIDGRPRQSHQTSILSRICGMNLRSVYAEK